MFADFVVVVIDDDDCCIVAVVAIVVVEESQYNYFKVSMNVFDGTTNSVHR